MDRHTAGVQVDRLAKQYAAQHNVDYTTALHSVTEDPQNAETVRVYAGRAEDSDGQRSYSKLARMVLEY